MPKLRTESFSPGDQTWLGSDHGIFNCRTSTIDISTFVKATHYPDGYIRSGQAVNVADEATVKPWTDAANEVLGFVLTDQPTDGVADFAVPILRHGTIATDRLPSALTKATGDSKNFVFVVRGA